MAKRPSLEESVRLAEKIAESEQRLLRLQQLNAPDIIIDQERDLLKQRMELLAADSVASVLLPKARMSVRMSDTREQAFRSTVLGTLLEALQDMLIGNGSADYDPSDAMSVYIPETQLPQWRTFCKALLYGNAKERLDALNDMLLAARIEFLTRDLPPVPPPYFEASVKTSKKDSN